ncbi:hypothetical protein CGRA01v4_13487 [Colletotrichum graminicola]|nr:hypothetical protein CGRA01v4_13487 [Colletotrichum graminicola]
MRDAGRDMGSARPLSPFLERWPHHSQVPGSSSLCLRRRGGCALRATEEGPLQRWLASVRCPCLRYYNSLVMPGNVACCSGPLVAHQPQGTGPWRGKKKTTRGRLRSRFGTRMKKDWLERGRASRARKISAGPVFRSRRPPPVHLGGPVPCRQGRRERRLVGCEAGRGQLLWRRKEKK